MTDGVQSGSAAGDSTAKRRWLQAGYFLIALLFLVRLASLKWGGLLLSRDEAYQWLWSKHLALSYYSKPPGIALVQALGTFLGGDNEFGVRLLSPVFAAILGIVMLRFISRELGPRQAFWLVIITMATPLLAAGSILMTVDAPLVFFGTLAMLAGWRAVQPSGKLRDWMLTGICAGLAFLSKYSALYLIPCFGIFFWLWVPARVQLRRPGPWLALLAFAVSFIPVVAWNLNHEWISLHHVAQNAALDTPWRFAAKNPLEFVASELGLLNPVFLVASAWAFISVWRNRRHAPDPLSLYFFSMSAPILLGHFLYSFHSHLQPNWIALAVVPMLCLMTAHWEARSAAIGTLLKRWLGAAVVIGITMAFLLHGGGDVILRIAGRSWPWERDPLRRLHGWRETGAVLEGVRQRLEREKGKPVFVIADHYGLAGLFSLYVPEARAAVGGTPLVYVRSSRTPNNQFFFWPEYQYRNTRTHQDALYVTELDPQKLESGWFWKWLRGSPVALDLDDPLPPTPPSIAQEFGSVSNLGVYPVVLTGQTNVFRRLFILECRDLKPPEMP